MLEVDAVDRSHRAFGFAEIEDAALAAGTQHTNDLAQPRIIVGEIAETERRSHQIEMSTWKRKAEGVGFDPF